MFSMLHGKGSIKLHKTIKVNDTMVNSKSGESHFHMISSHFILCLFPSMRREEGVDFFCVCFNGFEGEEKGGGLFPFFTQIRYLC